MANSLISTTKNLLLSATNRWSSISAAAAAAAITSFYSTQYYADHLKNSGQYILTAVVALHFLLFFCNPQSLRNELSSFFIGSAKKWAARITIMRIVFVLNDVPEQSFVGLIFVIFVWIDVFAIARIVRVSTDFWVMNSMLMMIVNRSNALYQFRGRYWLIMLICFPILVFRFLLDDSNKEEIIKRDE